MAYAQLETRASTPGSKRRAPTSSGSKKFGPPGNKSSPTGRSFRNLIHAMTRPNALSGRVTLLDKKDGGKRPIQILNQMRVQVEKVLADRLDIDKKLKNAEDIYGFVKGKGTGEALEAVTRLIEERSEKTCLLFLREIKICVIHTEGV